jgi:hypothetical protein
MIDHGGDIVGPLGWSRSVLPIGPGMRLEIEAAPLERLRSALRRLDVADGRLAGASKATFWPSTSPRIPARSSAVAWTKTSLLPSSG